MHFSMLLTISSAKLIHCMQTVEFTAFLNLQYQYSGHIPVKYGYILCSKRLLFGYHLEWKEDKTTMS